MSVSASVVATIIARIEDDFMATLAPGVSVFRLPEQDIVQIVGEPFWDAVIHRFGFGLLSITFAEWTAARVLAMVKEISGALFTSEPRSRGFDINLKLIHVFSPRAPIGGTSEPSSLEADKHIQSAYEASRRGLH